MCADVGNLEEASSCMPEIEDLLRRGIECGALPDPWFILGFDSQYNLFPAVENGIHDHRLDTLIDLLNDIFDLYSRLQKEAAAAGNSDLRCVLSEQMSDLAGWWDQYGSVEVTSVEGFSEVQCVSTLGLSILSQEATDKLRIANNIMIRFIFFKFLKVYFTPAQIESLSLSLPDAFSPHGITHTYYKACQELHILFCVLLFRLYFQGLFSTCAFPY